MAWDEPLPPGTRVVLTFALTVPTLPSACTEQPLSHTYYKATRFFPRCYTLGTRGSSVLGAAMHWASLGQLATERGEGCCSDLCETA